MAKSKILSNLIIVVSVTILFGYNFFFNSNNENTYWSKQALIAERDSLKQVTESLRHQISADSAIIVGIDSSDLFLERFARDNYYMKSDSEEIFIIQ